MAHQNEQLHGAIGVSEYSSQTNMPHSWEILEAQYEVFENNLQNQEAALKELEVDPAYSPFFEKIQTTYDQMVDQAETEVKPTILDVLEAIPDMPPIITNAFQTLCKTDEESNEVRQKLDETAPEHALYLKEKLEAIMPSINYKQLIRDAINEEQSSTKVNRSDKPYNDGQLSLDTVIPRLIQDYYDVLPSAVSVSHGTISIAEASINDTLNDLEAGGYILDEPADIPDPHEVATYQNTIDTVLAEYTPTVRTLTAYYRHQTPQEWSRITKAAQQAANLNMRLGFSNAQPHTPIHTLAHQAVATIVQEEWQRVSPADKDISLNSAEYQAFIQEVQAIDVEAAVDQIAFTGDVSKLPFALYALATERLKNVLREEIAPLVVANIRRIEFVDTIASSSGDKNDRILGKYSHPSDVDGGVITLSIEQINATYDLFVENAPEFAQTYTLSKMLNTFRHELGHGLHEVAPLALLAYWNNTIAEDPSHISYYAKDSYEKGKIKGSFEDFAEATAMFSEDPYMLKVLSASRCVTMAEIHNDLMPNFVDGRFVRVVGWLIAGEQILARNNMSEDEYRQTLRARIDQ